MNSYLNCDLCQYSYEPIELNSIFIKHYPQLNNLTNCIVCHQCLKRQLEKNTLLFIENNVEDIYAANNNFCLNEYNCVKCKKIFKNKFAFEYHQYKLSSCQSNCSDSHTD